MATMTNPARAGQAKLNKDKDIHVAWGQGNASWDVTPVPVDINAATLLSEYGRRKASQVAFCTPDVNGDIEVPGGKFSLSIAPTKYLYVRCSFSATDQPTGFIREVGVFVGTEAKSTVPSSQQYLSPGDIENPGTVLCIEHINSIERSNAIRQQFEFVVQF